MTNVGDDAHDAHHPCSHIDRDRLAYRILPGPQRPGQSLIDNGNKFARRAVHLGKCSTLTQRNSRRVEISIADNANVCLRLVIPLEDESFRPHAERAVVAQRQNVGNSRRRNTWNTAHAIQDVVDKGVLLRETRDSKTWIDPQSSSPLRLESKIYVENSQKTPNQESGADQEDAGEGKLGDHQSVADQRVAFSSGAAAAVLQTFSKRERRDAKCRQQAK